MRTSYAIAAWIFELLGLDDALAGDLLEEHALGRSGIWYWRQVLIAILISIYRDIRDHKVLALRAVATGCAINSLWILLVNFLHPWVPPLAVMRVNPLNHPLVMVILTQVATGWILARTHRPHEIPMVVMFTISLLPWAAGAAGDAFYEARIPPVVYLTEVVLAQTGLLLGGIIGADPKGRRSAAVVDE